MRPTFVSLFAGIGGLDLGFERAGWECVGQVEINEYAQQVLNRHWPEVPKHDDVRTAVDWWRSDVRPAVTAVVGGFPCQDLSLAGKRAGLAGERSGLYWDALRFANAVEARVLVLENVPGLLTSNGGADFQAVLDSLAASGFDAEWEVLPASAFGAHHERARIVVVAHRPGGGWNWRDCLESCRKRAASLTATRLSRMAVATRSKCDPSARLEAEPRLDRLVHGFPPRVVRARLTAAGNAVYPAMAQAVAESILAAHDVE